MLLENSTNSESLFCFFLLALLQQAEHKNAFSQQSSETRVVLEIIFCYSWEYVSTTENKESTEKESEMS